MDGEQKSVLAPKYRPEQFRPLGNHILVKVDPLSEMMSDHLYRPGDSYSNDDIKSWSTVIAVGPGIWSEKGVRVPVGVEVDDRVLVIRVHEKVETQTRIQELFGKGYLVLQPNDIIVYQVKEESDGKVEEGKQAAAADQ